ncbi:MAG TPA: MBL fold metallo-hydrolase [Lachnospiraceae bacterium]|nr:MBL fold metallo-hydrolase [Lachnospiraceae bacterium]
MKIESFAAGILGTNCYFIQNEKTKETVIVDPGGYSKRMRNYLVSEQLKPVAILLTHGHFDHMMGVPEILKEYPVPVYVYDAEYNILEDPEVNLSSTYTKGMTLSGANPVREGEKLSFAGFTFQVIYTPGHTADSCCYYVEEEGILFSGDTLFHASVGRSDLPTGSQSTLIRSIKEKLLLLPDEVKVLPGHMSATTIGDERRLNPFL